MQQKSSVIENIRTSLVEKIEDKSALVGVVGLGYVGLPFAVEKAKVGYQVIGIDQNPQRVSKVNEGKNYISDVNDDELKELVSRGVLKANADFSVVPELDVIVIAVPTPLTKNLTPDLKYIENVTQELATRLRPGQLICLESTTYPGTTEEVMLPLLEKNDLKAEEDFYLAHSPERVDPGNKRYSTKNTTKVVGGIGPASLELALCFYSQTIEQVVPVSSAKAAELVKVFENTFRAVNIALVNELAVLCDRMGLNVWEVLDAAFTKAFGIMPFYPGPGVGGHCIPVDPHYLEWKAKELNFETHFINLAGEINRKMPEFVRDKTYRILNGMGLAPSKSKVLVMGVAYKKDLSDYRESPAAELISLFIKDNVAVNYHDPFVPNFSDKGLKLQSIPLNETTIKQHDLIVITTDHSNINYNELFQHATKIFDTRNVTKRVKEGKEKAILL